MNNIQKSFKSKARCGLRMAVGGVIADPTDQQRTPDSDLDRLTAQSNMSAAMAGLSNTERYQLANPTNAPYKANSMMGGTSAEASMLRQRSGILASHLNFGEAGRGWDFRSPGHGDVDFEAIIRAHIEDELGQR